VKMASTKEVSLFLSEAGALKQVKRAWFLAGVENPESVAEHIQRSMLIGYALAEMEGVDAKHVTLMLLFHDLPETRLGDLNKIQQRYLDKKSAEMRVAKEQAARMPAGMAGDYLKLFTEFEEQKSKPAIVAKDAELLECAFQALEYRNGASPHIQEWVARCRQSLKTESAKKLLQEAETAKIPWWDGLKVPLR